MKVNAEDGHHELWAGAAALTVLLLGYMLFWWDRGIQLNSNGLDTLASLQILAGKVPYRDFHFWCPPGHLLVYTVLTAIFGDGLIYVRAFSVVERILTFLLVYFWLARTFSARSAFFGTVSAGVGFSSDVADVISHYGFDAVLASVAAGFAASVAMTSKRHHARAMYFVAGICAGASMLAKQTQGVGVFLVLLVIFLIGDSAHSFGSRALRSLEYLAGWLIPVGLTFVWLSRTGAWHPFIEQAFLQGTSSKGSLGHIIFRPLVALWTSYTLGGGFLIAVFLMAIHAFSLARERHESTLAPKTNGGGISILCFASFAALSAGFAWAWYVRTTPILDKPLAAYSVVCIFISLYGSTAIGLQYTLRAVRGTLTETGRQIWIVACLSAVTAYMFSLSWAAFEQMLIPGFAFLMAMALDRQLRSGWNWRAYCIVALGLILICTATFRKLNLPYAWENWADGPIRSETEAVDFPELRGIRITEASAAFLRRVTRDIEAHSRPDETIFCFPNYALLYVLSHRAPAVFAYMHWFDVVSDALAREDAARIRAHPPAVILFVDLPDEVMTRNERNFRASKRSGQRELAEAIPKLPGYRLVDIVPIPYVAYPLKVYARD